MVALNVLFILLVAHLFIHKEWRAILLGKSQRDWILDSTGLFIQGILIPVLQTYVFFTLLSLYFPNQKSQLFLHPILSFCLHFIVVDYLYYWNHRLFHHKFFWPIHKVHHSATDMDVFVTSRNSVYTSFCLIYVWVNTFFIFILQDPTPYLLSITVTAGLDLWKHSKVGIKNPKLMNFLSSYLYLMTPQDHAWHHGTKPQLNYGANLNVFDRLHATFLKTNEYPSKIGIKTRLSLFQELFNPFSKGDKP